MLVLRRMIQCPLGDGSLPLDPSEERAQGGASHGEATELVRDFFEHIYPVPSCAFL